MVLPIAWRKKETDLASKKMLRQLALRGASEEIVPVTEAIALEEELHGALEDSATNRCSGDLAKVSRERRPAVITAAEGGMVEQVICL